jgi:precorrin-2/cobalt-factor-2 C20-methyltransferase
MSGILYGLGVGPGDPELLTLKAHRILREVGVIAYPAPDDGASFARSIAAAHLREDLVEIPIIIPMRVSRFPAREIYDKAAREVSDHLESGRDVAVLCEGDPFFYGSFMYLFERLAGQFRVEIVPGVSSLMAAAATLQRPLAARNDILTIIPAPLPDAVIGSMLASSAAVAIIKIGRHFPRIKNLIENAGLGAAAGYLERIGLENQRVLPLKAVSEDAAPYFSMILIYKGEEGWIGDCTLPFMEGTPQ